MKEIKFFNIKVHPLSRSEFLSIIKSNLTDGNKLIQIGVNSASVNELEKNEPFRRAVSNADLVNIDGVSVVLALRFMGYKVPERVATPDLADDILKMAEKEGFSVFLFGARETTVISCKENLQDKFPGLKIVGYRNGYFQPGEEPLIVEHINKSNPDILLIAMPSPTKELFFDNYGQQLKVKYILGVGGYFDIKAGLVRRAPKWVQNIGMEWFYRFIQEPRRMWRRYLLGNTHFFWLVLKEKFSHTMH
jgi:N-acetylglucosaminyldiphosphoundecaprenol N-acetyl-beta-D-mannosaminyltransferase